MAVVRVNITLKPDLLEAAKAYATDKGLSLSALIQDVLEERIKGTRDLELREIFNARILDAIRTSPEIRAEINEIITQFMNESGGESYG